MSETSTLAVVLGFAAVCVTQAVAWNDGRRQTGKTNKKIDVAASHADTAAEAADLAAKRAEPISNGFAEKVLGSLEQLKRGQSEQGVELHEVRQKLDRHIGDHAAADVLRGKGT